MLGRENPSASPPLQCMLLVPYLLLAPALCVMYTARVCDCESPQWVPLSPQPQTDPCNTPCAEPLLSHWFLVVVDVTWVTFNKTLGWGLGDYLLLLPHNILAVLQLLLEAELMVANQKATASGVNGQWEWQFWHSQVWALPTASTEALGTGSCLAVAAGKSVLSRLLCAMGHPREGRCCLSPGEMEVHWQLENECVFRVVYFLPSLSNSSASVTLTSLASQMPTSWLSSLQIIQNCSCQPCACP